MDKLTNKKEEENEVDNPFIQEMRNELKRIALEFKKGKEDSNMNKTEKLCDMLKLSSTIKILKTDYIPVEIVPHLYLGSIGCASNLKELQKVKITHILCCGTGIKNFFPNLFKYYNISILDSDKEDIKKYFESCHKFINDAIKNNGNVLVHCFAGSSRSSSILLSYIMKYQNMNFDKAFELVKSKRDKVNPKAGFIKQLKEYETELNIK